MRRWALLCGGAIVLIIILADIRHLGFLRAVYAIPFGDKVGHFAVFGLLSLLVNLAVFEARPGGQFTRLALWTSAALAVPIGLEEFSQRWISSRSFSFVDLAASYLGLVLFAGLAIMLERRRRNALQIKA